MPIDTSSYYPEVPSTEGDDFSLNHRDGGLFGGGDQPQEPQPEPTPPLPPQNPSEKKPSKDDEEKGWEKFVTAVSHWLSWLFVPLMMPVYGLILAFGLSILDLAPMRMRVLFTFIVAGIDLVIPMLLIMLLKKMKIVDDLGLNGQKERLIPYIITIVCYLATAWFMATKNAPQWMWLFFCGGALGGFINMLINFRWKISAHAAGIAGIVALLIRIEKDGSPEPQLFFWLITTIIVAGLLGSARVWLGRHTVWQVLAGYAVGFCSVFFLTMIR